MSASEKHLSELLGDEDENLEDEGGAPEPEAAPEPTAADEPNDEPPKDDDEPPKDDDGSVPRSVLIAERKRLQEQAEDYRRQLEQTQQANERYQWLEQQVAQMRQQQSEAQKKAQEAEDQPPNYEDDPEGYFKWHLAKRDQQIEQLQGYATQYDQQQQQSAHLSQIQQGLQAAQQEFTAKQEDFPQALQYVREINRHNLSMLGYTGAQLEQAMMQSELATGAACLQQGRNPAEYFYNVAKNMGYQAQEKPKGDDLKEAEDKERAKSMGGSGGSDGTVADMDEDEFSEAMYEMFGVRPEKGYTDV